MDYDELLSLSIKLQAEVNDLRHQNEDLESRLTNLLGTFREKEKQLADYHRDIEIDTKIKTWQNIVDEMAHSINTDVFVAVYYLSKKVYADDPQLKKALYHTKQIRDLINLFLSYIKRSEIKLSGEKEDLNLSEIVKEQIAMIKDGISTLRISDEEHEKKLLETDIEVIAPEVLTVSVAVEYKESVTLILKDLLRNAMKHSSEESPVISVDVRKRGEFSAVTIKNNAAISRDYADWLNDSSNTEPEKLSKSVKVGLRVIKMWKDFLRLPLRVTTDDKNNFTTISISFPKEIKVE